MVLSVGLLLYAKLFLGQMLFASDVLVYQLPEKYFIGECLRAGFIPFLNPYILSGAELYSNMDAGVLNPLNIILLFSNQSVGYNLFVLIHYLFAMLSMYLLLSQAYKLNSWICMLGGVAYGEGYLWSMSGNGFYRCAFLIPLFLLFYMKYLEYLKAGQLKKQHIAFIISVIALSLLFYSGNFLEAYFAGIFAGAMGIYFSFLLYSGGDLKKARNILIGSMLMLVLSVMIASPVLIPVILASLTSYRSQGIPILEAQQWSFPPLRLIEYFVPFIFGARQNDGLWYDGVYTVQETFSKTGLSPWADCIYVGIPVILGFILMLKMKKGWKDKFVIFSLGLAFLLALGKLTPVYECFYYLLPGFKMFRHPEKFMFWVNFWLIVGGCSGLHLILSDKDVAFKYLDMTLKVLLALFFFLLMGFLCLFICCQEALIKYVQSKGSMWNGDEIFMWESFTICLSVILTMVLFSSVKIFKASPEMVLKVFFIVTVAGFMIWKYRIEWTIPVKIFDEVHAWNEKLPEFEKDQWRIFSTEKFQYPVDLAETRTDSFKMRKLMEYSTLDCNAPGLEKIRTVKGFSPIISKAYGDYMNFERHDPERLLDLLSVKYIGAGLINENQLPKGTRIVFKDESSGFVILENTDAVPRVRTYSKFIHADEGKVDEAVFDKARDISSSFVLASLPENFKEGIKCPPGAGAHIASEDPNRIEIKVENGPCWVVIRDWCNPGWTCFEDGRKIQIVKADGGLMAVFCDSENSTLEFKYFPPGLKLGLLLMTIAYVVLLGFLFLILRKQYAKEDKV